MIDPNDRTQFLGGSDIAAILGLSNWSTQLKVYLSKTGGLRPDELDETDREKLKLFKRGKRLEPVILEMLIDETGLIPIKRSAPGSQNRYYDDAYPFMSAEIDFEFRVSSKMQAHFPQLADLEPDEIVNGEIKSSHYFVAKEQFGEEGTDEIPVEYAAQCAWGQMVTKRRHTLVVVLVGNDQLLTYHIRRDDQTIDGLRRQARAFWFEHVLAGVPPDPMRYEDVIRLFRRDVDTMIDADAALEELVIELKHQRNAMKSCREREAELRFQIGVAVLGADNVSAPVKLPKHVIMVEGLPALAIIFQHQNRIDADKLRDEFPDIALACTKASEFFSYNLPRGKKA